MCLISINSSTRFARREIIHVILMFTTVKMIVSKKHISNSIISEEATEVEEENDADCVTIRLRFIDETQFEVRSPLTVTLGHFKSRHLRPRHGPGVVSPIQPNDRVRLIFNGKVLQSDSSTLAQHGFQHNCTVHCLVQREVLTPNAAPGVTLGHDVPGGDLDLSNLCYPVLGTVLFIIWWCQVIKEKQWQWVSKYQRPSRDHSKTKH